MVNTYNGHWVISFCILACQHIAKTYNYLFTSNARKLTKEKEEEQEQEKEKLKEEKEEEEKILNCNTIKLL